VVWRFGFKRVFAMATPRALVSAAVLLEKNQSKPWSPPKAHHRRRRTGPGLSRHPQPGGRSMPAPHSRCPLPVCVKPDTPTHGLLLARRSRNSSVAACPSGSGPAPRPRSRPRSPGSDRVAVGEFRADLAQWPTSRASSATARQRARSVSAGDCRIIKLRPRQNYEIGLLAFRLGTEEDQ